MGPAVLPLYLSHVYTHVVHVQHNLLVLGSGCPFICGETAEETAGGRCGVCLGVRGQTRESCPHGCMQGMYCQVRNFGGVVIFFYLQLKISLAPISHCRVFLALVEKQEDRGTVVAQGGGKVWHCKKGSWFNLK